ncbi:MAG TPA: hypothetical protein VFZ61_03890, partial [Polyangiales bacterium]
ELGVHLPKTNFGTIVQILYYRAWLAVRRRASDRDVVVPGSTADFTVRVLHNFGVAISPFDALALILVTLRGIRLVPRAASSELLSAVYIALGWLRAMSGKASAALFDKSHMYASQTGNPTTLANVDFSRGSALLMNFEAEASKMFLERAQHTLQTRSTDQTWLLRNVRYLLGSVWYLLGEHRRVAEESERWIVEARERNDQLSVALYAGMGFGFIRHLMRDAPDDVHTEFQIAMREAPKDMFTWLHWGELFATVNALLYKGGPLADLWFAARAKEHGRTMLLKLHYGRTTMALYRALAALHAYDSRGERQRLAIIKRVRKLSKHVEKNPSPAMRVYAKLLHAQLHVLRRDLGKALECARAALAVAPGYADYQKRIAQYLVALLESHDERDPRCESVVQSFRAQGWRNPHAFLRLLLP